MLQKTIKRLTLICLFLTSITPLHAANDFLIIPEASETWWSITETVKYIGGEWGKVVERYNEKAEDLDIGTALATGIMTRDTLINYIVYLIRFLSQIGLFVGALMILYAGYQYATAVFRWWSAGKSWEAIKYAVMGTLVVTFAYAFMNLLTRAFLY